MHVNEDIISQVYPRKLEDGYHVLFAILDVLDDKDYNTNKYVFPEKLNFDEWTKLYSFLRNERPDITDRVINYFIKNKCIEIKFKGKQVKDVAVLHDIISSEPNLNDLIIKLDRKAIDKLYSGLFKGIIKCEKELGIISKDDKDDA